MLKTIDKANETISDLLFLSRIAGKPQKSEAVSISSIMTDLAELATTLGEDKGLTITTDIQPDIILKADKKLLQRALSNIVYNAVFYNKPQGSIHLSLKKNNDSTIISVKDTGIGVSKNDMPQLFTRFFRGANAENQGSGLGLAISKAVVENMGGKVTLTSALDKGTTVSATFS
jgi:two-component system phosphate regulon sensor histidine kinase PhoR